MDILKAINIYSSTTYYYLQRKKKILFKNKYSYKRDSQYKFEEYLNSISSDNIFIHTSLSSIKQFSPIENSFHYLKKTLLDNFKSITTNSFTPQVKELKLFDVDNEKAVYGTFAKLISEKNNFRNHDPLYSLCGIGDINLDPLETSFHENGTFKKLILQDYSCLNIGLNYVTCSLIHLIELENNVPYINMISSSFVITQDEYRKKIEYLYYDYKQEYSINGYLRWNKFKLMKDLRDEGLLFELNIDGVQLYHFNMKEFYNLISEKVERDPLYLITW